MKRILQQKIAADVKRANVLKQEPLYRGILLIIELINFMCHEHLIFELRPNINFICGRNGSGKSAILTAIIVALSGKTSSTSRGSRMKDFIQTGKKYAEVRVHLQNQGAQAFHPEIYGPVIIIERRIPMEGATKYKIKSHDGKVQSEKSTLVNSITRHFGIQVDNPLTILNQDTSRQFLTTKSNHDKYKFFQQATGLDLIALNVEAAERYCQQCQHKLAKKLEDKEEMEKELQHLEEQLQLSRQFEELQKNLEDLNLELTWAFLTDLERQMTQLVKIEEDLEKNKEVTQNKLISVETSARDEHEKKLGLQRELREKCLLQDKEKKTISETSQNLRREQAEYRSLNMELKDKKVELESAWEEIECLEDQISREKQEDLKTIEASIAGLKVQINEKKESLQLLQAKKQTHETHKVNLLANHHVTQDQMDSLKMTRDELIANIRKGKSALDKFDSTSNDNIFGSYTSRLLYEIDKAYEKRLFIKKPIGPIGKYISLKDKKWAVAVEICIKSMIHAYCVDNRQDHDELLEIMKQVMPTGATRPTIIISPFKREVHSGLHFPEKTHYPTVYHMLHFNDPVVANCLIDQMTIESTLLVEEIEEAKQLMIYDPPPHCIRTYTLCGDRIMPDPNFRFYSNTFKNCGHILKQDSQAVLKHRKEKLEDKEQRLQMTKEELDTLQKDLLLQEKNLKDHNQNGNKISSSLSSLKTEINNLEGRLRHLETRSTSSLALLEKNLGEKKKKHRELQLLVAPEEQRLQQLMGEIKRLKAEQAKAQEALLQLTEEEKNLKNGLERIEKHMNKLTNKSSSFQENYKSLEREIHAARETRKTKSQTFLAMEAKSLPRPENYHYRSPELVKSDIQDLTTQLSTAQHIVPSQSNMAEKYEEKKHQIEEEEKSYRKLTHHYKKFSAALNFRKREFIRIRDQCTIEVDGIFSHVLRGNKFAGKLIFDHELQSLEIKVSPFTPGKGSTPESTTDLKTLSGGERSFSTIAVFLALWRVMDSPFRILDEYDVFMDQNNRFLSTQLLLEEAQHYPSNQYIFLTPQPFQHLPSGVQFHLFQLKDPREDREIDEDE